MFCYRSYKQKRPFGLIDLNVSIERSEKGKRDKEIDWSSCVLCQTATDENLIDPCQNNRAGKEEGIALLSRNIPEFSRLGDIPCNADYASLSAGPGVYSNLKENGAK